MVTKKRASKKASAKKSPAKQNQQSVEEQLESLDDLWDKTPEPDDSQGEYKDLPDGKYVAIVEEAVVTNSKNSGRLQLSWTLRIADGPFANRKVWKHDGLDKEDSLRWVRTTFNRMELEWPSNSEGFKDTLGDAVNQGVEISIKTKPGRDIANVYINGLAEVDNTVMDTEEENMDFEIEVGGRVAVDFDGDVYVGTIKSINEDEALCVITFEDGDEEVAFDDIMTPEDDVEEGEEDVEEEEQEEEEEDEEEEVEASIEVGSRVSVDFDGEEYEGSVVSIPPTGKGALVEFDDGTSENVDLDDMVLLESEDEEEEEEGSEELEWAFEDDDFNASNIKKTHALAEQHDFDVKAYESPTDLLTDLAETCEVTGSFAKPLALIKAIEAA